MHTRFSHSSITLSGLLLLTINLICYACSSDNEDSALQEAVNQASAPDDPRSEFRFYKENADYWSFKVTPTDDPSCPLLVTSSTTTRVDNPYFDYTKNGDNTADVFCYFTTVAWNNYGSWQQYELTLTFLSPNHGIFEGVYKNTPTATGVPYKGVFVYDTDLEPEDFFSDENNESDIDWSCLTDFTWKATDISYKFNTDNTFSSTLSNGQSYNGKYNIDYTNNILNLTYLWETSPTAFRVLRLNEEELTMVNAELDDRYAETYISDDSPSGDEYDINISAPEITDITEESANISGTVLGDVTFKERGFVYSIHSNPTVNDYKKVGNDVITSKIRVARGVTYYVRMYAIIKDKIYYGKQVSFTAKGKKLDNFRITQIGWTPTCTSVKVERPVEYQRYGVCWGEHPNPKITDNYTNEVKDTDNPNQVDEFHITDLKNGKRYYLRPYHIVGSRVEYYDDEVVLRTYNDVISMTLEYDAYTPSEPDDKSYMGVIKNMRFILKWNNVIDGIKKIEIWTFVGSLKPINSSSFNHKSYIDSPSGEKTIAMGDVKVYGNQEDVTHTIGLYLYDTSDNKIILSRYDLNIKKTAGLSYSLSEYHGH